MSTQNSEESKSTLTQQQKERLEQLHSLQYDVNDPCLMFYTMAQVVDPHSGLWLCTGRDLAYAGDFLVEAAMRIVEMDEPTYTRMFGEGAIRDSMANMFARLAVILSAKSLKAADFRGMYEQVKKEWPVDRQTELLVKEILCDVFISAIYHSKRTASKVSADGKGHLAITDMGELLSMAVERFYTGKFEQLVSNLNYDREAFYEEYNRVRKATFKRMEEQRKKLEKEDGEENQE